MKWLKDNKTILTLLGVIVSLCIYIYQKDLKDNEKEHINLENKNKEIEKKTEEFKAYQWNQFVELNTEIYKLQIKLKDK